jgi:outer membrane protein assembly factor BamD
MTMKKYFGFILLSSLLLGSCNSYNEALKTTDYDYKYEVAKECYAAGRFTQAYQLLEEVVVPFKGSDRAEEALYMIGMCHYNLRDYETSSLFLDRYVKTYPKGDYTEIARFYSARGNFLQSPDPRLDQSPTYSAINKLQEFLDFYPYSTRREDVNDMIFQLQDRLVQKEYDAAELYYNLGSYTGNCMRGGSNYEACIITAENALRSYPYTNLREDLSMMVLRARYELATQSVEDKADERYRQTIDEYYGFKHDFPDSKYMKEANNIFKRANARVKKSEAES